MRGVPYGTTPGEQMAFALAHPVRRFALMHAAQQGRVHALHIQREFTDYNRTTARDILHVLRDRQFLEPAERIPDIQGKQTQLTYRLTPHATQGLQELLATCQAFLQATAPEVPSDG